ncbi:MAG: hypothetical protein ABUJ92_00025 [Desulfobacterales bacterium]
MKYLLLLLLSFNVYGADWTASDTARETAWHAVNLVDWGQTLDIVREREAGYSRYERNPLLGKHPSRNRVNTYFALSHIAHYSISKWTTKYRAPWQYGTIAASGFVVGHNFYIGLSAAY